MIKPMTEEEFYTAPDQRIFDDIKENAIKLWQTYDNEFGYVTGKVNTINKITNFKENCTYIVGMFDDRNKIRLRMMITKKRTAEWLDSLLKTYYLQYKSLMELPLGDD